MTDSPTLRRVRRGDGSPAPLGSPPEIRRLAILHSMGDRSDGGSGRLHVTTQPARVPSHAASQAPHLAAASPSAVPSVFAGCSSPRATHIPARSPYPLRRARRSVRPLPPARVHLNFSGSDLIQFLVLRKIFPFFRFKLFYVALGPHECAC